ncbi:MAG TPA: hypothetical protein VK154_02940 [Chitinophagales bacterium]|nr:hypothetical protein [Chitinophagales bacterium]
MLDSINKDNFQQALTRFSTHELETLVEKFPYFQQAHLLLAKKYQEQNHPKFDQQLQLAVLYTHDRELLYSIFNDKSILETVPVSQWKNEVESDKLPEIPLSEEQHVSDAPEADEELLAPVSEEQKPAFELAPENSATEKSVEEVELPVEQLPVEQIAASEPAEEELSLHQIEEQIIALTEEKEEFSTEEPHTFGEWLQAYSTVETPKIELKQEEIPAEPEKLDEELEKLYVANIPVNLQELVEEETHYSKGLDRFIEEQIQKHKAPPVKTPVSDNELDPEFITETMAKVYEMQKKYSKAIKSYEILALKYPEKNDFFAARINYLKNIT